MRSVPDLKNIVANAKPIKLPKLSKMLHHFNENFYFFIQQLIQPDFARSNLNECAILTPANQVHLVKSSVIQCYHLANSSKLSKFISFPFARCRHVYKTAPRTCLNLVKMLLSASGVLPRLRAYPCCPTILSRSISAIRVMYGYVHSRAPTIAHSVSKPERFSK